MIKTETFQINGVDHIRTWSDIRHYVVRNGIRYEVAEDLASLGNTYTESADYIPEEVSEDAPEEILGLLEEAL